MLRKHLAQMPFEPRRGYRVSDDDISMPDMKSLFHRMYEEDGLPAAGVREAHETNL